ncbi:MAG TPA: hypothetical protein VHW74_04250 [Mycobacteriales bacterium]|jgi:hypothetical protein|nr:hypothetical protein [Mycobacteriales bacterium]
MAPPSTEPVDSGGYRLTIRELRVNGSRSECVAIHQQALDLGERVTIGQQSSVQVGAEPLDRGVSRLALAVSVTPLGWDLELENRNGHTIHRWAALPEWSVQGVRRVIRWPRVGVLIAGVDSTLEHWVLLESDLYEIERPADSGRDRAERMSGDTVTAPIPRDVTPMQRAAVQAIFAEHLAWPPAANPVARSLDSARHRLGVGSESAVKARLQPVRDRAYGLGLARQVGLTDPTYVYHLAELGYFVPPTRLG